MTLDQFKTWLQGYLEAKCDSVLTEKDREVILAKLNTVSMPLFPNVFSPQAPKPGIDPWKLPDNFPFGGKDWSPTNFPSYTLAMTNKNEPPTER